MPGVRQRRAERRSRYVEASQVNCQDLVADFYMEDVKGPVRFQQEGADVTGFVKSVTGLSEGTLNIAIRPLWFHYDVVDKCGTTQLGENIADVQINTTDSKNFTLSSTTLANIEGRSIVLQTSNVTACASIQQEGDYVTAAAYLQETIFGNIFFRQHTVSGSTFINSDLKTAAGFSQASWFLAKNDLDCDNIGDPTTIEIFNPDSVNRGSCSQDTPSGCAVGNLFGKFGSVQLADASSSNRSSYRDSNLPLFGDNNIADKYLVVFDLNNIQNVACTKISVFKQRNAVATFSHGGVTGSLVFKQRSPFDPTLISTHLQGLAFSASGYHVHDFPVPLQSVANENLCQAEVLAAHLNPYGVPLSNMRYPLPEVATHDLYETGDLSSKHGTLEGVSEYGPFNRTDWNLPLFGQNSIVGRSIVIHRNDSTGSRWVCTNIELDGSTISASAVFTAPVIGHVYFTQTMDNPETAIFVRLNYIDGRAPTSDHSWQISTNKVGRGMDCSSTGMVYNPKSIWAGDSTYSTICSNDARLCKPGDLSGRLGTIGVGKTANYDFTAKGFYTDSTVHLSGPNSVIGRSVVIMESSGSNMLSCATIQLLHDVKLSAQFDSGTFNGKVTFSQNAGFGQIPTMVSVEGLSGFNEASHGLEIRTHPIASGDNPCASLGDVYNPLEVTESSPQTEDQYEVGDLSRRGSREMWYDFNLPIKGPTSILGHSLAIMNQNNVVACANIGFDFDGGIDGYMVAAKLVFSEPVVGEIEISQIFYNDETLSDASIIVDLKMNTDIVTNDHNWHVHESPIAGDATADNGRCASAGPHYDPFSARLGNASTDYLSQCGKGTPLRCEVGDQALKLGTYDLGSGAQVYSDVYLPMEGEYSIQGRSIVVHIANRGADRLACADIIPINGIEVSASFQTPQNFNKVNAAQVFANALNTEEENVVVELVSQSSSETSVNIHFLGKDRVILRSRFLIFLGSEANRQSLGEYSSITVNRARPIISSVVVLMLSLIIGKLMSSA